MKTEDLTGPTPALAVVPNLTDEPADAVEPLLEERPDLDAITDEQARQMELQMPPLQNIALNGATIRVVKDDDSDQKAIIVGPVMMNFIMPLTADAAHAIARELTGGIEIAQVVPPTGFKAR